MRVELTALLLFAATAAAQCPLDAPVTFLNYHVRVEAPAMRDGRMAVMWNGVRRAEIDVPAQAAADNHLGAFVGYRIFEGDSCISRGELRVDYSHAGVSAVLKASPAGALLTIGSDKAAAEISVPFDCDVPVGVDMDAGRLKVLRNDLITRSLPAPEYVDSISFGDAEIEGYWVYLDGKGIDAADRNMRIAVMSDGPGSYTVTDAGRLVLGRLTELPYPGNFDAAWNGEPDAYAYYDARLRLLTIHLPAARKKIRMRREAIF